MSVLNRKLWRTIKHTKGQFIAVVAVVTIGICVYIAMSTVYYNLSRSLDLFYKETNFADYYFQVIRAPLQVTRQIEALPGVSKATGRIQKDVPLLNEHSQRATARLISYPLPMENEVNRLYLLSGRLFERYPQSGGVEILTDPQYAKANDLTFNSKVHIVAEGKQLPLTVVGTAASPEFIYTMKDASTLMPDPETFGIIMLPQNQTEQILNYPGQINQVVVTLLPGTDEKKLARQIETILDPYGNLAAYPRADQLSHAVMQTEIDSLRNIARFMPAIFLGVAAAIQFIMLGRMVKSQRGEIGLMKAIGYSSRQIMLHYIGYALTVAFAGALLGAVTGVTLASVMSQIYAAYFNLPDTISGLNSQAVLYGFMSCAAVSLAAGWSASRSVVGINPAESMHPESPKGTGKIFLENWSWFWRRLSATWKMSLRSICRKWSRFAVTLTGVVFAVGLLVLSLFTNDSINYMFDRHFQQEQHYDYLVRFGTPVKENDLFTLARLEGVIKVEPLLELPVKMYLNERAENDVLQGLPLSVTLKEPTDDSGKPLRIPEEGLLIDRRTADKLGAKVGDWIKVETLLGLGPARYDGLKVIGVSNQLIGNGSYLAIEQVNRLLRESGLVSGAMLRVEPGKTEGLTAEFNEMTNVSSISSPRKELENLNQTMDTMIYTITVLVFFAALLGFAIIYNASVISFAERKRDLAALRVLGFSNSEVSGLLLQEIILQSLLGIALGLPFGRLMAEAYLKSFDTDIFTIPAVFSLQTYLFSALGGLAFVFIAHLLVARGIKKLDLVDVLKNKD